MCGDLELMKNVLEELDHTDPPNPLTLHFEELFIPAYGWFYADTPKEIKRESN